jgi:hypothetical protein
LVGHDSGTVRFPHDVALRAPTTREPTGPLVRHTIGGKNDVRTRSTALPGHPIGGGKAYSARDSVVHGRLRRNPSASVHGCELRKMTSQAARPGRRN